MDPIRRFQNYAQPFKIVTGTSHEIKGVVDSLSKKDLKFICPQSGKWVESPFKELRYIAKAEDGDVMGFIDGYCFPDDLDYIVLVIAIKEQYRGTGAADELLQKAVSSEAAPGDQGPVRLRDDRRLDFQHRRDNLLNRI